MCNLYVMQTCTKGGWYAMHISGYITCRPGGWYAIYSSFRHVTALLFLGGLSCQWMSMIHNFTFCWVQRWHNYHRWMYSKKYLFLPNSELNSSKAPVPRALKGSWKDKCCTQSVYQLMFWIFPLQNYSSWLRLCFWSSPAQTFWKKPDRTPSTLLHSVFTSVVLLKLNPLIHS